jgi:hypothetical protein
MKIKCDNCFKELLEQGALIFSPPKGNIVRKIHICTECWHKINVW